MVLGLGDGAGGGEGGGVGGGGCVGIVQTHAPTPFQAPPSPHRLFDLQDSLDKLIHFVPQLSDFVPLRNVFFFSFREQTD